MAGTDGITYLRDADGKMKSRLHAPSPGQDPIVLDPEGNLANVFQTSVIPTSVLIDRRGTIVWKNYGAVSMSDSALKRALEKALNEKS